MSISTTISPPCGGGGAAGGGAPPPPPPSGGNGSAGGGPCGACKFLRRKCIPGCIFAPYFDSEQGAGHFAAVHKVFGASNVSKMLLHIPVHKRLEAVATICFEAQARLRDPVYGCVAHIFALQQQVVNLQAELNYLQAHLATLELPSPAAPPAAGVAAQPLLSAQPLSMIELLPTTTSPYDMSTLFDHHPMVQQQQHASNSTWPSSSRQQMMDLRHFSGGGGGGGGGGAMIRPIPETSPSSGGGGGNGDLQELARELLQRRDRSVTVASTPLLPRSQ